MGYLPLAQNPAVSLPHVLTRRHVGCRGYTHTGVSVPIPGSCVYAILQTADPCGLLTFAVVPATAIPLSAALMSIRIACWSETLRPSDTSRLYLYPLGQPSALGRVSRTPLRVSPIAVWVWTRYAPVHL
jgi:hypothetical protein